MIKIARETATPVPPVNSATLSFDAKRLELATGAESEGEEAGAVGGEVGFELDDGAGATSVFGEDAGPSGPESEAEGSGPSGVGALLGINGSKLKKFLASEGGTVAARSTLPRIECSI